MFKDTLCKTIRMPILVKLWYKHVIEYYAAVEEWVDLYILTWKDISDLKWKNNCQSVCVFSLFYLKIIVNSVFNKAEIKITFLKSIYTHIIKIYETFWRYIHIKKSGHLPKC